jgi:methyl-accepting chemotaxis protein
VRTSAKQTARVLSEQSAVVASLASAAQKHNTAMHAISRNVTEQATSSQQIAVAMTEMRGQAREIATGLSLQTKVAAAVARDVASLAPDAQFLRKVVEQAANADGVAGALAESNGGRSRDTPPERA